jgi:hypothetical protein
MLNISTRYHKEVGKQMISLILRRQRRQCGQLSPFDLTDKGGGVYAECLGGDAVGVDDNLLLAILGQLELDVTGRHHADDALCLNVGLLRLLLLRFAPDDPEDPVSVSVYRSGRTSALHSFGIRVGKSPNNVN